MYRQFPSCIMNDEFVAKCYSHLLILQFTHSRNIVTFQQDNKISCYKISIKQAIHHFNVMPLKIYIHQTHIVKSANEKHYKIELIIISVKTIISDFFAKKFVQKKKSTVVAYYVHAISDPFKTSSTWKSHLKRQTKKIFAIFSSLSKTRKKPSFFLFYHFSSKIILYSTRILSYNHSL